MLIKSILPLLTVILFSDYIADITCAISSDSSDDKADISSGSDSWANSSAIEDSSAEIKYLN